MALIAVLAIAAGSWLTYRTVQLVRLSRQVDVKVDGSRQYKSGRADAKLLKKYAASQPAALLTGRTQAKKRSVVLLFAGLTDSEESNERILRLLKQAGVKATFALPAARARENDVLLRQLLKNGQQIIGNGITGSEGSEEAAVLLPKLQLAKRTLAAES
ncbi:polysaccharide deacetylase family protein, partial [Lactobacillus nasalidis]